MSLGRKHVLLPPDDIADWIRVPGPDNFSMNFYMNEELNKWLYQDTVGRFYYTHKHIYFEVEEDAVIYALRWM